MDRLQARHGKAASPLLWGVGILAGLIFGVTVVRLSGPSGAPQAATQPSAVQSPGTTQAEAAQAEAKAKAEQKSREETAIMISATETRNNMLTTLEFPNSAQFRNVWAIRYMGGWVFCGEINARDGTGDFAGYQGFIALGHTVSYQREAHDWPRLWAPCAGERIIDTPF